MKHRPASIETIARAGSGPPHLVHVIPSFGHGGVPLRITTIINALGDEFRHTVVSLAENTSAERRLDPDLNVTVRFLEMKGGGPLTTLRKVHDAARALRPDLMLTYNWGSIEWAFVNRFFLHFPHIHLESGFGPEEADGQLPRRVWARRIALPGAYCIVVPSRTLVSIARDQWKFADARIRYIANGVDCSLFHEPADPVRITGFAPRPGELIVGTLAPLRPEKNLKRLLRVFAEVKSRHDVRLLIAGDGAERPVLEDYAGELGLGDKVVFLGHVEQPEYIFNQMDIFAITSDTEQMPNTLIQAMASSRAVVGVDAGDIKWNLSPENAELIVPRDDETALAATLDRLLSDAAERARLAAANRRHVVEHYSADKMFAAYREAYHDALTSAHRD